MFNIKISGVEDFTKELESEVKDKKLALAKEYAKIGEAYIAEARKKGKTKDYIDRSGYLRNANSYRVYIDGVNVFENIGVRTTADAFDKVTLIPKGVQLVVGNGMHYATYVERLEYDVASSGFLLVERMINELHKR